MANIESILAAWGVNEWVAAVSAALAFLSLVFNWLVVSRQTELQAETMKTEIDRDVLLGELRCDLGQRIALAGVGRVDLHAVRREQARDGSPTPRQPDHGHFARAG